MAAREIRILRATSSPGLIFDITQLVDRLIGRRQGRDCIVEKLLHLATRNLQFGSRLRAGNLAAFLVQRRELQQGQQRFTLFELPANALGDLGESGAERG